MARKLSKELLDLLPIDGSPRGNISLQTELDCTEDEYFEAKTKLLDEGKIVTGRGRGGSIWLSGEHQAQKVAKNMLLTLKKDYSDGIFVGNTALSNQMNLANKEIYWAARDILLAEGKIIIGTGRGGSVALVLEQVEKPKSAKKELPQKYYDSEVAECDLMLPLEKTLKTAWAKDLSYGDNYHIFNTANQGKSKTGGVWSRPDFVACVYKEYEFSPNAIELTSFEIKPYSSIDVRAVYETLSHNKFTNNSYLMLHIPKNNNGTKDESLESIYKLSMKHGIGLIYFENPMKINTWDIKIAPVHTCPHPWEIENFFTLHSLDPDGMKKVRSWLS